MSFQEQHDIEQVVHEALRGEESNESNLSASELLARATTWSTSLEFPNHLRDARAVLSRIQAKDDRDNETHESAELTRAFGIFVGMQRRAMRLTLEGLATKADIDPEELVLIESTKGYEPKPRTVRQLGLVFKVSAQSMAKLANLKRQADDRLLTGSVAFAACANNLDQLTREQKAALKAFVKVLNSIQ